MALSIGMVGQEIRKLQVSLNLLPSKLPRLQEDGNFGGRTRDRVKELQGANGLDPDGVIGPLTLQLIDALLRALGGGTPVPVPAGTSAVRPINQQILGLSGTNNLILQTFPSIGFIVPTSFRPNDQRNKPLFMSKPVSAGRIGVFAARKGNQERAVMLALPAVGAADRMIIFITQSFGQASKTLNPLGWSNPLSKPFIEFALLKHIVNRFGAQILTTRPNTGLIYFVRANGSPELGPFANDGAFVKQVINELIALTNNAFSIDHLEAFTFSSGINDFNPFMGSIAAHLPIEKVYSLDPNPAITATAPKGAARRQFLTGQTFRGAVPPHGFEYMPLNRWSNESAFDRLKSDAFEYLHNHCAPNYFLQLGMMT